MNEVRALVEAFDAACAKGERCALATVVSVEGSSYRRPGARMLVREGGQSTGTISAGCLESDVVEHAKRVIAKGKAVLVEYDTASTGEEMAWGLGLGCNGIVRVLVEPLAAGSSYVEALRRSSEAHAAPLTVATVYRHATPDSATAANHVETGARLFIEADGSVRPDGLSAEAAAAIEREARALSTAEATSGAHVVDVCGVEVKVFVETLLPPVPLVVFGAGHDALPVVELARSLGWHTEVVDPQARAASLSRFAAAADKVTLARPEEVAARVRLTPRTLALLMTHNYSHDLALLRFLLASPARYVGVMGPRKRTERMLRELAACEDPFRPEESELARLHSPAGLDIGANAPAEIALSIVAEMRAVLEGRRGGSLRERRGSIHGARAEAEPVPPTDEQALTAAAA